MWSDVVKVVDCVCVFFISCLHDEVVSMLSFASWFVVPCHIAGGVWYFFHVFQFSSVFILIVSFFRSVRQFEKKSGHVNTYMSGESVFCGCVVPRVCSSKVIPSSPLVVLSPACVRVFFTG